MKWKAPTGRWWRQWRQRSAAALVSAGTTSISVSHALQTTTGLGGNNISGVGGSEKQTLRKERSDSHIFIFCTFFSLKCGISDFLALRAEVRWLKNLANNSLWGGENTIMHANATQFVIEKAASRWQCFTALSVNSTPEPPLEGRPASRKSVVEWLNCGLPEHERCLTSGWRQLNK